jgi:hypothetical protein
MFERFTERARQVVVGAQEASRDLKHHHIGTEHILLGLLLEEEGLAARVLGDVGLTVEIVRADILEIVGMGEEGTFGQIPFTHRGKRVLELALREALSLEHNYIGTEHLLLGLIHDSGLGPVGAPSQLGDANARATASRIFERHEIALKDARDRVIEMLSGSGPRRRADRVPEDMPPRTGQVLVQIHDGTGEGFAHPAVGDDFAYQQEFPRMPWVMVPGTVPLFFIGGNSLELTSVICWPDGLTEIGVRATGDDQSDSWHEQVREEGYRLVSLKR